jgi:low temperature requirement protein LtrA
MFKIFKQRFWQPPRAHGEVVEDRSVGFIELFYDLVYVVVIAQAAHHLAEHISWRTTAEFAVIFGMIWLAWLNGTLYQDLHGRDDGRSRTYIFLQMGILVVLAVYTGEAAGESGQGFAVAYTVFLGLLTWMWYTVRRQDSDDYAAVTARYLFGMAVSVVVIGISAFLPESGRVILWAAFGLSWAAGSLAMRRLLGESAGITLTDSTIERFGLFTIIVLGEVVVGVVDGLSEATRDFRTVATGLIGLSIGFGAWWTYFDFVGRRFPRGESGVAWMYSHLPVSMGIAGAGAALVSLVAHAGDSSADADAAWLLSGSIALTLVSLIITMRTLADHDRLPTIYQPLTKLMVGAAIAVLLIGWWRPAPWLFVLALFVTLSTVWWFAVDRYLRLPDPSVAEPGGAEQVAG